jgi:hypothetical protein
LGRWRHLYIITPANLTVSWRMPKRRPIRLSLATVALLLAPLLVIATTTGSLWHHHVDSNEASCPICHMQA